jgi:membrane protein required for colicin V production
MIFFDLLTLVVIGWMVYRSRREGFISQLVSLAGLIIGITISISFGEKLGQALGVNQQFAAIVGFLIIFIITAVIATILTKILSKTISFAGLDWLNTILGIVFAAVKGVVILSMLYAAIFAINERTHFIESKKFDESASFNVVRKVASPLLAYWERTKPAEQK